jgi:hypothetical protein
MSLLDMSKISIKSEELIETLHQVDLESFEHANLYLRVRPEHVVVLAHIHCLDSMMYLFESLLNLYGLRARNIFILPKRYSAIKRVVDDMLRLGLNIINSPIPLDLGQYDQSASSGLSEICRLGELAAARLCRGKAKPRIILLDDGGLLTERWVKRAEMASNRFPLEVISVQQTASGVYRPPMSSSLPKINVAFSAGKRKFESRIIASGVIRKIEHLDFDINKKVIGIAGYGSIGSALASSFHNKAGGIIVYDRVDIVTQFERAKSQRELFKRVDIVFGCTGKNWVGIDVFDALSRPVQYVSCSSRDVEFQRLLQKRLLRRLDTDECGCVQLQGGHLQMIHNGGFPINFDRMREWESLSEIAVTRGLMLAGIIQAMCISMPQKREWNIRLAPNVQMDIVHGWLNVCGKTSEDFALDSRETETLAWWKKESLGADA